MLQLSPLDIATAARTVYGEARGEPEAGKIAVSWVIRNRAEHPSWWSRNPDDIPDDTVAAVCRDPKQFTCWQDHNFEKLMRASLDDDAFRQCLIATAAVFGNLVPDPTQGSCHYHVVGTTAKWTKGRAPTVKIGNHVFYAGLK